jgi:sialic acid synthase SpsE
MDFYNKILKSKYPYVIAEIGSNHNGDLNLAKQLVLKAKEAGADAVKFQSWTKNSIFSKVKYRENYFLNDDYRIRNDTNLEKIVTKYSIKEKQLYEIYLFCKKLKIDFSSTPFSKKELDFIITKTNAPFIKIASMDLNNIPFIEYVAKKNKPIVLSVGLSELSEIDTAIKTIEKCGNKMISILHCTAIYPVKDKDVNLNNIETLKKIYPYPIGFSDHSIGTDITLASVVKGAKIIEKHFTLDKNMEGWDHKISADFNELKTICDGSKKIIKALGSHRILAPEEDVRKEEFRRSAVAKNSLKKNQIIREKDIDYKRPGRGISPFNHIFLINRKINKDISKDQIIKWDDLV